MPKYLVFTDLQAKDGITYCRQNPDVPLQRWRVDKFIDQLFELAAEHEVDGIIDLGDTTDDRNSVELTTLNQVSRLGHSKYGFIKLIGNHEQFRKDQSVDTRTLYPAWNVVSGNQVFKVGGCTILASAYSDDFKATDEWVSFNADKNRSGGPIVVLGHWDVVGAEMSASKSLFGVKRETLDKADLVLLGHIHKPQQLGKSTYYVGSPFQQDYGEAGEEKRVGLLELEGGEVSLAWIRIDGMPQYYNMTLDVLKTHAEFGPEDRLTVPLLTPEETIEFDIMCQQNPTLRGDWVSRNILYGERLALQARDRVHKVIADSRELMRAYLKRQPLLLGGLTEEEAVEAGVEITNA